MKFHHLKIRENIHYKEDYLEVCVLVDFGSTYTKMVCVNIEERKVVATDKYPSTVSYDAAIGLYQCFDAARAAIGDENFRSALKLATSSAAGGLRMAVVGLTKSLSMRLEEMLALVLVQNSM